MSNIKKYIPSFGRKHGRNLKVQKVDVLENLLPKLQITSPEIANISGEIHLEIGYGNGEHICHRAVLQPDITFIGCEVYEHGIATCLKEIQDKNIENIRLYTDDARLFLEELPDNSINKIYLLFPDPWPKKKHHKRRIVNQEMLDLLHRIITKNGKFSIATDHHEYAQWIITHIDNHGGFESLANEKADWRNPPEGHIITRYQTKNKAKTQYPLFLNYSKQ